MLDDPALFGARLSTTFDGGLFLVKTLHHFHTLLVVRPTLD